MENILIELANLSDINSILEIENLSFDSDKFSKRQFSYLITESKGFFYVARVQGLVFGYISLLMNTRTRTLRVYSIAVHPSGRGMGIAQKLIDKAIEDAGKHNLQSVTLEVKVDNLPAIALYEKKGFMKSVIKPNYYSDGSPAHVMKLIL